MDYAKLYEYEYLTLYFCISTRRQGCKCIGLLLNGAHNKGTNLPHAFHNMAYNNDVVLLIWLQGFFHTEMPF